MGLEENIVYPKHMYRQSISTHICYFQALSIFTTPTYNVHYSLIPTHQHENLESVK
jgi:hypothetical protein